MMGRLIITAMSIFSAMSMAMGGIVLNETGAADLLTNLMGGIGSNISSNSSSNSSAAAHGNGTSGDEGSTVSSDKLGVIDLNDTGILGVLPSDNKTGQITDELPASDVIIDQGTQPGPDEGNQTGPVTEKPTVEPVTEVAPPDVVKQPEPFGDSNIVPEKVADRRSIVKTVTGKTRTQKPDKPTVKPPVAAAAIDRREKLEPDRNLGMAHIFRPEGVDMGLSRSGGSMPLLVEVQNKLNILCGSKCKTELCYLADDKDCRNFITCQKNAMGLYRATLQPCAFGTYWAGESLAQRNIICDLPENVKCNIAYCAGKPAGVKFDHLDGNCKTHWECSGSGKPLPRCCGDGYLYDDRQKDCVKDKHRECHDKCPIKIDACMVPGTTTEYFDDGNCRTYWNCVGQNPHPMCCPEGEGYDVGSGCVKMPSCNDTCPKAYIEDLCLNPGIKKYALQDGSCRTYMKCNAQKGDERWCCASNHVFDSESQTCILRQADMNLLCSDTCPSKYNEECPLLPDENTKSGYLELLHDVYSPRPCAPGTEFNFSKCGCATPVKTSEDYSCNKELEITFDDPLIHRAGSQKQVIITEHGSRREGPDWQGMKSFRFDGDLFFRTPFLQSQYQNLYIKVTIMPDMDATAGRQVLLSNCMNLDLGAPSLELSLQNGRLVLDLVTDNIRRNASSPLNNAITVSVPYTAGVWNNVSAIYDGKMVYLFNENERGSEFGRVNLTGPVSVAAEGLDFGGCFINRGTGEGYIGSIAHLEFSKCLKKTWREEFSTKIPV